MRKVISIISISVLSIVAVAALSNSTAAEERTLTDAERLYNAVHRFSVKYQIPLHIAFNVANIETGYRGPCHDNYNPRQTSHCGALGPMQIMPQWASHYAGYPVTKKELRDSIELNVELSMKILADNFKRTKSWKRATGKYNTGKPIVNSYAKKAVHKNYMKDWIE
jgi:soluble lytic murein transglycosylase-like protein